MKKLSALIIALTLFAGTASASDLKLEIIGASAASNLYLCYLSIGVIADSGVKEVYETGQSIAFINSVTAQMKVQIEYLEKFIASGEVPEGDMEIVKKMKACYSLLVEEGDYLVEFLKTGSEKSLALYDEKRKAAWDLLSDILGL